jgi:(p)ppGpp synthase/HD superfamily hydrolase
MIGEADRQRIATMRLHEITAAYGELGPRIRFAQEEKRLASTDDRIKVNRALTLASQLHAVDQRQRQPYINHPLRVALRIMCHHRILDADVISAALLHDAVEDHADDLSPDGHSGALTVLAGRFGRPVAVLVAAVTNPAYETGRDKYVQYREHLVTSLAACPWARVVKASEFADNVVGLHYTTGALARDLARKYAPVVQLLKDMIQRPDTPLAPSVRAVIVGQLAGTERRFVDIDRTNADNPTHDEGR